MCAISPLSVTTASKRAHTPTIQKVLGTLREEGRNASPDEAQLIAEYANHARRHLIVENAIIVPLARARLTAGDLDTLRLRMQQRRAAAQEGTEPYAE